MPRPEVATVRFDDKLWDNVWERNLNAVERHALAMSVWRRRQPDDVFEALVARELARRWRRHARYLIVLYGVWTWFWGALAVHDLRPDAVLDTALSPTLAAIGVAVILACLAVRRRLAVYLRMHPAPDMAVPDTAQDVAPTHDARPAYVRSRRSPGRGDQRTG